MGGPLGPVGDPLRRPHGSPRRPSPLPSPTHPKHTTYRYGTICYMPLELIQVRVALLAPARRRSGAQHEGAPPGAHASCATCALPLPWPHRTSCSHRPLMCTGEAGVRGECGPAVQRRARGSHRPRPRAALSSAHPQLWRAVLGDADVGAGLGGVHPLPGGLARCAGVCWSMACTACTACMHARRTCPRATHIAVCRCCTRGPPSASSCPSLNGCTPASR